MADVNSARITPERLQMGQVAGHIRAHWLARKCKSTALADLAQVFLTMARLASPVTVEPEEFAFQMGVAQNAQTFRSLAIQASSVKNQPVHNGKS